MEMLGEVLGTLSMAFEILIYIIIVIALLYILSTPLPTKKDRDEIGLRDKRERDD